MEEVSSVIIPKVESSVTLRWWLLLNSLTIIGLLRQKTPRKTRKRKNFISHLGAVGEAGTLWVILFSLCELQMKQSFFPLRVANEAGTLRVILFSLCELQTKRAPSGSSYCPIMGLLRQKTPRKTRNLFAYL